MKYNKTPPYEFVLCKFDCIMWEKKMAAYRETNEVFKTNLKTTHLKKLTSKDKTILMVLKKTGRPG